MGAPLLSLPSNITGWMQRSNWCFVLWLSADGKPLFANSALAHRLGLFTPTSLGWEQAIAAASDWPDLLARLEQAGEADTEKEDLHTIFKARHDLVHIQWTVEHFPGQGWLLVGQEEPETIPQIRRQLAFAKKTTTIINEISDGIYQLDADWRFVQMNPAAERTLGLSQAEVVGKTIWELFGDSPGFRYPEAFRRAMNLRQTVVFDDYRPDLDKWFRASAFPSAEGLTVFFQDVTAEHKAHQKLAEQDLMLEAIYHSTTDACTYIDKNFVIRYINDVARKMTLEMFGREARIGDASLNFIFAEQRENFTELYRKAIHGSDFRIEVGKDDRWWFFSIYPVFNKQRQIIGLAHNVKEITERKQREVMLRESEHKLHKTIEAIPHPLIIFNEQLQIVFVNARFEQVFGHSEQAVLGQHLRMLHPQALPSTERWQQVFSPDAGTVSMPLTPLATNNKFNLLVNVTANSYEAGQERLAMAILQDQTEATQHKQRMDAQEQALRQISWLQSHEIRRPLSNIMGLCHLIKEDNAMNDQERASFMDMLEHSCQELDQVIRNVVLVADEHR